MHRRSVSPDASGVVKVWLTFNEPYTFCNSGYGAGGHAPGRCSDRRKCAAGDSSTEPYICTHNVLRSHALAVEIYKTRYAAQRGEIGLVINSGYGIPATESPEDCAAAARYMAFQVGWYGDPLYYGDYPAEMRAAVGSRLPQFTAAERARLLANPPDFYAMNHYSSKFVRSCIGEPGCVPGAGLGKDMQIKQSAVSPDGTSVGAAAASAWLRSVPEGIRHNLVYVARRYADARPEFAGRGPAIYITENGCDVPGETELPLALALDDEFRVM